MTVGLVFNVKEDHQLNGHLKLGQQRRGTIDQGVI